MPAPQAWMKLPSPHFNSALIGPRGHRRFVSKQAAGEERGSFCGGLSSSSGSVRNLSRAWNERFLSVFPKIMRCRYCEPSVYRWEILGLEKLWKFVQVVLESVRLRVSLHPNSCHFYFTWLFSLHSTHRRVILWYMCYCSARFWACSASSTGHFTY